VAGIVSVDYKTIVILNRPSYSLLFTRTRAIDNIFFLAESPHKHFSNSYSVLAGDSARTSGFSFRPSHSLLFKRTQAIGDEIQLNLPNLRMKYSSNLNSVLAGDSARTEDPKSQRLMFSNISS